MLAARAMIGNVARNDINRKWIPPARRCRKPRPFAYCTDYLTSYKHENSKKYCLRDGQSSAERNFVHRTAPRKSQPELGKRTAPRGARVGLGIWSREGCVSLG